MIDSHDKGKQTLRSNCIDITGIVVVFNEEARLDECLNNLDFCNHLLVIDLGSTDRSIDIARNRRAEIIESPWVPIVELARGDAIRMAKSDWVAFMDPDMIFPKSLLPDIYKVIAEGSDVGWIELSYVNYFRGKKLIFSRWMRPGIYPAILHKDRVVFSHDVHAGMTIKNGFKKYRLTLGSHADYITHYWGESYTHIINKHKRYLLLEGKSLYSQGKRFTLNGMFTEFFHELKDSIIKYRGISGGLHAWLLTIFWLWYVLMRWHSLNRYERTLDIN